MLGGDYVRDHFTYECNMCRFIFARVQIMCKDDIFMFIVH